MKLINFNVNAGILQIGQKQNLKCNKRTGKDDITFSLFEGKVIHLRKYLILAITKC